MAATFPWSGPRRPTTASPPGASSASWSWSPEAEGEGVGWTTRLGSWRQLGTPTDATTGQLDEAGVEAFAGRLFELYTGGMLTFMIDIGHRTGLFAAARGRPRDQRRAGRPGRPATPLRAGVAGSYMVTGGIAEYDPETWTYRLPAEHAACLTGPGSANLAPFSRLDTHLAKHVDAVARAFRRAAASPMPSSVPSSPT